MSRKTTKKKEFGRIKVKKGTNLEIAIQVKFYMIFTTLLHELCFPLIIEIHPMTDFYRLQTHRRSAHMKFFHDPFLFQYQNFCQMLFLDHSMQQRVKELVQKYIRNFMLVSRTTVSQDVQTWFPVPLAFPNFLSKINGNFLVSDVSLILALY